MIQLQRLIMLGEDLKSIMIYEVQFTDGCGAQYKSKTPFHDLSTSKDDIGHTVERSYFGSGHGKGPCDGIGSVIRTACTNAVKTRTHILDCPKAV